MTSGSVCWRMSDWRFLPPFKPQSAAPRPLPLPPSSAAPLSKKAASPLSREEKRSDPQAKKREQQFAYNAISWTIQILCSIATVLGLLWATIQLLGLFNFLGISREPPGLAYHVPDLAPEPPPPPA